MSRRHRAAAQSHATGSSTALGWQLRGQQPCVCTGTRAWSCGKTATFLHWCFLLCPKCQPREGPMKVSEWSEGVLIPAAVLNQSKMAIHKPSHNRVGSQLPPSVPAGDVGPHRHLGEDPRITQQTLLKGGYQRDPRRPVTVKLYFIP